MPYKLLKCGYFPPFTSSKKWPFIERVAKPDIDKSVVNILKVRIADVGRWRSELLLFALLTRHHVVR